jgi:hypothetical protein
VGQLRAWRHSFLACGNGAPSPDNVLLSHRAGATTACGCSRAATCNSAGQADGMTAAVAHSRLPNDGPARNFDGTTLPLPTPTLLKFGGGGSSPSAGAHGSRDGSRMTRGPCLPPGGTLAFQSACLISLPTGDARSPSLPATHPALSPAVDLVTCGDSLHADSTRARPLVGQRCTY